MHEFFSILLNCVEQITDHVLKMGCATRCSIENPIAIDHVEYDPTVSITKLTKSNRSECLKNVKFLRLRFHGTFLR